MIGIVKRRDYCEFLIGTQVNYTCTYFADHTPKFSHDAARGYLKRDKIGSGDIWKQAQGEIIVSAHGYLVFDDTVADKNHSKQIKLVRRQWSGNSHRVIRGIGMVNCVYVNPDLNLFWIIDFRLYDIEGDGKTKLDHLQDMLNNVVQHKRLPFVAVLMDTWYAKMEVMKRIETLGKLYYCPLQHNRQVDDSDDTRPYQRVDQLTWSDTELIHGKTIHLKGFPKGHRVKLFRLVISNDRTDYVVTNDMTQDDTAATHSVCGFRWKIEQFHREVKQITGLELCQCRLGRSQRNHFGCAVLVWMRLKSIASQTGQTVYQLKQNLLDDYMRAVLRDPPIKMAFA
jgi:DDE superfamily endonuclease